jgi:hypothetical protein
MNKNLMVLSSPVSYFSFAKKHNNSPFFESLQIPATLM